MLYFGIKLTDSLISTLGTGKAAPDTFNGLVCLSHFS